MITFFLLAIVPQSVVVLAADRVHLGDGRVLGPAFVTLEDGKIKAIEEGTPPQGAVYVPDAELTPGLVDAYSFLGVDVGGYTVDESRESGASQRLSDTADLDHEGFQHALSHGVTSAFLSPDSANVFGGVGAFVKTFGGSSAGVFDNGNVAANLIDSNAALKITLGKDPSNGNRAPWGGPSSYKTRRPTTRMGTVWEIRRHFYRALAYRESRDSDDISVNKDLEVLLAVLEGRLPLRVQARRSNDIQTALRLREEFSIRRMIIEEGTEAWRVKDLLASADVPVVSGPAYDDVTRSIAMGPTVEELRELANPVSVCCEDLSDSVDFIEGQHSEGHRHIDESHVGVSGFAQDLLLLTTAPRYDALLAGSSRNRRAEGDKATPAMPSLLSEAGVVCALGSAESHDSALSEASLIYQARIAVRWGLRSGDALAMVTSRAAALCGQSDRLGFIGRDLDADLVLWSGNPLSSESRPLLVVVDGLVAADFR